MTRNAALAQAARRVRALAERVPELHRPDIAVEWGQLLDRIEDEPDRRAIPIIEHWVGQIETRITGAPAVSRLKDE